MRLIVIVICNALNSHKIHKGTLHANIVVVHDRLDTMGGMTGAVYVYIAEVSVTL